MYYLLILFFFLLTQGNAAISTYSYQLNASPTPTPQFNKDYEQAIAYENGVGVIQDPSKAFDLFLQCAKQGDSRAKYKVGLAYFNGVGVAKDQVEGLAWMHNAVRSGISGAVRASMEKAMGAEMSEKARKRAGELGSGSTSSAGSGMQPLPVLESTPRYNPYTGEILEDLQPPPYETEFLDWMKAHPTLKDVTTSELFDLHEGWLAMRQYPTGPNQLPIVFGPNQLPIVARRAIEPRPSVNPSTIPSDPKILNSIGQNYEFGTGETKSIVKAAEYYRMAAGQSYPPAQYNLARLYQYGMGVNKNSKTAFSLFYKAAMSGHSSSQAKLGIAYALGNGVPKNRVSAYMWFNIAAADGIKEAAHNREIVEKYMTPFQIQEAQRLSSEWSPQPQATP
jgi:TPR repeat protein